MKNRGPVPSYWKLVEDCLVELFGQARPEAREHVKTVRLQLKMRGVKVGSSKELIYHAEPFSVAAEMAKLPLGNTEVLFGRYKKMRQLADL